jgi:hypothetical protein
MGLENVDEKRFTAEEALAAVETGFAKAPPRLQPVVSAVTAGNCWANVLRRYLIGESVRICVTVGSDAGVFWYPPGSDISDEVVRRQLEDFTFDGDQRRIVPKSAEDGVETKIQKSDHTNPVFEIGETVRKAILKAQAIDAARANPSMDAVYSLREISAMAVGERLEQQWVG